MRLPHDQASVLESAARFRRRLTGPVGCLLALLLLPFLLLGLVVFVAVALWKGRRIRKQVRAHVAAQAAAEDAVPVALLVRTFAIDPTFTRDEVAQGAVAASSRRSATELLDEAIRRGWVEERGAALAVTDRGREAAEDLLRARGY